MNDGDDVRVEDELRNADDGALKNFLNRAAREGDLAKLRRALDHAQSSRGTSFVHAALHPVGMNALMMAALAGSAECIELLLQRGAAVDHLNDLRCTALHYATWRGYLASMKVLLDHGACVDVQDRNGQKKCLCVLFLVILFR